MSITVGYWSIRGLGAPLRMMVMYSGEELQAECYDLVPSYEVNMNCMEMNDSISYLSD